MFYNSRSNRRKHSKAATEDLRKFRRVWHAFMYTVEYNPYVIIHTRYSAAIQHLVIRGRNDNIIILSCIVCARGTRSSVPELSNFSSKKIQQSFIWQVLNVMHAYVQTISKCFRRTTQKIFQISKNASDEVKFKAEIPTLMWCST